MNYCLSNMEKNRQVFLDYVTSFQQENKHIIHKINHTFSVITYSELFATKLKLSKEDIYLAKVIALLHDIGRFYQADTYGNLRDYETLDHAKLGVKILFEEGLIERFEINKEYYPIIQTAILNHNKYTFCKDGLNEREILHSKLIRDADKTDSFPSKIHADVKAIANVSKEDIEQAFITDEIYNDFMNEKLIISKHRKTAADVWISYLAFIFDFNYPFGLAIIKEHKYIDQLIDRFDYKQEDTKIKIDAIKKKAREYLNSHTKNTID